jgi:hypothetical protein
MQCEGNPVLKPSRLLPALITELNHTITMRCSHLCTFFQVSPPTPTPRSIHLHVTVREPNRSTEFRDNSCWNGLLKHVWVFRVWLKSGTADESSTRSPECVCTRMSEAVPRLNLGHRGCFTSRETIPVSTG